MEIMCNRTNSDLKYFIAVSYTHLDVYKRQGKPAVLLKLEPSTME